MADRFPGYDVLAKRDGLGWNDLTRAVVDERLALGERDDVLDADARAILRAIVDRIVPQPEGRAPVNAYAILLARIAEDASDGFRPEGLPRTREAWTRGLRAIEREAQARHGCGLVALDAAAMDALLDAVHRGAVDAGLWDGLDAKLFFAWRLLPDIVSAYWAHPSAWSAMGFGGPASPRGYVRLDANRRDGWEAAEAADGALLPATWRNALVR